MTYSLTLLTTAPDCDTVLTETQFRLRLLNHQAEDLAIETASSSKSVTGLEVALAKTQAEINSLNYVIPTITDIEVRKDNEVQLRRAVNRQAELLYRRENKGGLAVVLREVELGQVQAQITELTTFAAAVTAHKATL
jgi:hypothetical protein